MSLRTRLGVVVLWVLSIVAASWWASAQVVQPPNVPPTVLSGNDVGFRVEGRQGTAVLGKFVVRINGQWMDARFSGAGMTPAATQ